MLVFQSRGRDLLIGIPADVIVFRKGCRFSPVVGIY